jgi:glycosyltransferase involved in cell wall biosynthesis
MSRLIINASNLRGGGALQVASTFIEGLKSFGQNDYFLFLPPALSESIKEKEFTKNFVFYRVDNPSIVPFFNRVSDQLSLLESQIRPDCVFSLFGPTYWIPKSHHVMGFANGLYLYGDLPYIKELPFFERLALNFKKNYHRMLLKNNADSYVVQTDDMKTRFAEFIDTSQDKISVVYGSYHPVFSNNINNINNINLLPSKKSNEFWFVTISSYYPHKNLDIINEIVDILSVNDIGIKIKFILTLPHDIFIKRFNCNSSLILNVGPIDLKDCPYLYSKSDALFLPTLVESFTASYPEAMIMKKPILTSDYQFAKTVCTDSALYFDPYNINDVMSKIIQITTDKDLYKEMVNKGVIRVKSMPTFLDMTKKYLDICNS